MSYAQICLITGVCNWTHTTYRISGKPGYKTEDKGRAMHNLAALKKNGARLIYYIFFQVCSKRVIKIVFREDVVGKFPRYTMYLLPEVL